MQNIRLESLISKSLFYPIFVIEVHQAVKSQAKSKLNTQSAKPREELKGTQRVGYIHMHLSI